MNKQFKNDAISLFVRFVACFARGIKINNIIILSILSPLYLAFIWGIVYYRLTAMLHSKAFYIKPLLRIDGMESHIVLTACISMSLFLIFPICRILQLSFPETFEPFADSVDRDD